MIVIHSKDKCSGCTACASICPTEAITMHKDEEGFEYPVANMAKCLDCHLCEQTCPIMNKSELQANTVVYAVQNRNMRVRLGSSAGGFFATVAEHVLANDGIVFGAGYDQNLTVIHQSVESKEQLDKSRLCGSKYVQSELGETFKKVREHLDAGKVVCFSGVPCQVAGLKSYLGNEHENLILIDLVCYGVPSPKLFKKYVDYCSIRYGVKVVAVNFRDKSYGYSSPNMRLFFANGKYKDQTSDIKSFLRAFFCGISSRPSCYSCNFKTVYRISDFTLGDCKSIGCYYKSMDDDRGTTAVYVHTEKGLDILNKLNEDIVYAKLDLESVLCTCGKKMTSNDKLNPKRQEFFSDMDKLSYKRLINRYAPEKFVSKVANLIKPLLYKTGLIKHGVLKTIVRKRVRTNHK